MRYVLTHTNKDLGLTKGTVVESVNDYDYGMKADHERITGQPHINVRRSGDPVMYTIPQSVLKAA